MCHRSALLVPVLLAGALVVVPPAAASDVRLAEGPPHPPTDLRAAAVDREVSLDWDAPAGGPAPVTYAVYRELLGRASEQDAAGDQTLVARTVDTRYRDQSPVLRPGRSFVYAVRATSAAGSDSTSVRVSVTAGPAVPGEPQHAPALRGRLARGGMQLDWTAPPSPVDAFVLHRRDAGRGQPFSADGNGTIIYTGADLSHLDEYPFDAAEDYGFAVQTQVNGVFGPLSEEVRLTQPRGSPPSDPVRLDARPTPQGTVRLTWNTVDHGKEYLLYKEDAPGSGTYTRLVTRYTSTLQASGPLTHEDKGVRPWQTYRYYVLCYGSQVGGQVQSNDAAVMAVPALGVAPSEPPGPEHVVVEEVVPRSQHMVLHAVPGTDEVEVRWNAVPEAVSYEIQGGPVFGRDGLPSRERYTILADKVVTTSFRHKRTDDEPWEYFGFWLDPSGFQGAPTKYQGRNVAYGRRLDLGSTRSGDAPVPVPQREPSSAETGFGDVTAALARVRPSLLAEPGPGLPSGR